MNRSLSYELPFLARHRLAMLLDLESPLASDWRGLADKMGFTYGMVTMLRSKQSPTMSLLEEWERLKGCEATLENLIHITEDLGNRPAVETLIVAQSKTDAHSYFQYPPTPPPFHSFSLSLIYVYPLFSFYYPPSPLKFHTMYS